MNLTDLLLPDFDGEMAHTRRTLERVPGDRLGWKPHPKSGTMGWLATHVARLPSWASMAIEKDSLDLSPGGAPPRPPAPVQSTEELLEIFDGNASAARRLLAEASDERLLGPWTLLKTGKTLFTMTRIAVIRNFVLHHIVHHRAQLGVYLRLNDVPLPAIYGPSADEGGM